VLSLFASGQTRASRPAVRRRGWYAADLIAVGEATCVEQSAPPSASAVAANLWWIGIRLCGRPTGVEWALGTVPDRASGAQAGGWGGDCKMPGARGGSANAK
jgi:hypothetical protein